MPAWLTLCSRLIAVSIVLAVAPPALHAQGPPPSEPAAENAAGWSLAASVYGYWIPGEDFLPVYGVEADRDQLHLEGRWNYEAEGAGSLWVGWTFSFEGAVALDVTPMIGGVYGDLSAIAPGIELDLTHKRLNLYVEGEYVEDLDGDEGDFVYGWTELTYAPTDWFRAGLVGQRTRLYDTGLEVQRGLMVAFTLGPVDIGGYFFNPGGDDAFEVASLSVEW